MAASVERPDDISCWIWYDKQHHADLSHWQNCLFAAHNANAKDVIATAEKMYDRQGGVRLAGLTRREWAKLAPIRKRRMGA